MGVAGVAEAIVEAEAVPGMDVRDSCFKQDFYSYGFLVQVGVVQSRGGPGSESSGGNTGGGMARRFIDVHHQAAQAQVVLHS